VVTELLGRGVPRGSISVVSPAAESRFPGNHRPLTDPCGQSGHADPMVDVSAAAEEWARVWERGWPVRAIEDIAALYQPDAPYRSSALAAPEPGGARAYLRRQFAVEEDVQCVFGTPIVAGNRAAVEWWASWVEDGQTLTLAGTTLLRFAADGLVSDHVDYWVQAPGRQAAYPGWGR
jgi:nuclear transport factor 2 (NTF2) superfamily protein